MREKELSEPGDSSPPPPGSRPSLARLNPGAEKGIDEILSHLELKGDDLPKTREAVTMLLETGYSLEFNFTQTQERTPPALDVPEELARAAQAVQRLPIKVTLSKKDKVVSPRVSASDALDKAPKSEKPGTEVGEGVWLPLPGMREQGHGPDR